jgi:hypothetical protein
MLTERVTKEIPIKSAGWIAQIVANVGEDIAGDSGEILVFCQKIGVCVNER